MASVIGDRDASLQRWVERLAVAATTGTKIDLADGGACDPATADDWRPERTVPAAALREILTRRDLTIDPHGLRIRGARIIDNIDLAYVRFDYPLHLTDCRIDGEFNMEHVVLRELKLTGTLTRDINLDLAEIDGDIYADQGFRVNGQLCVTAATIKSQLILNRATLANLGGNALLLDGATIANGLHADGVQTEGCVRAPRVHIDGGLFLNGATLTNPADPGVLILHGAEITGDMAARNVKAEGAISAKGARIGGSLILDGATVANLGGVVLDLSEATIGADVKVSGGFTATGEVRAIAAHIGGNFEADNAVLSNPGRTALTLTRAAIAGSMRGSTGGKANLRVDGELLAQSVQIGGQVDLRGVVFTNANRTRAVTLNLDSAKIAAGVHAANLRCDGMFYAFGAQIGGPLELSNATFSNRGGQVAVALEGAEIAGDLIATECETEGSFFAPKAQIKGKLRLYDATVTADSRVVAISLEGAQIREITLGGAQIKELRVDTEELEDGVIDLTRAVIGRLETAENDPAPGKLVATGWEIADVAGGLRRDKCARQWLETTPSASESVQPWHGLAAVYERNGDFAGARRLRLGAADQVTEKSRWPTKILRTVYRLVVGHGYYPLWAAFWLALVVVTSVLLVQLNLGALVPTNQKAAQTSYIEQNHANPPSRITAQTPCSSLGDYPCVHPVIFTLSSIVPAVAANPSSEWTVRPPWLTVALFFLKLTAWILTALLLAGVTGLLRKT